MCETVTPTEEALRARGWLSAERLLEGEVDMDAIQDLVGQCGPLTGSKVLDRARRTLKAIGESHSPAQIFSRRYVFSMLQFDL
jgi:hypothetical protein